VLKNPSFGHSSKNGFVEAFGLTGVERAFGEATKLARRQPPVPAAPPAEITQSVDSSHSVAGDELPLRVDFVEKPLNWPFVEKWLCRSVWLDWR
jgi:hypothetical protein